MKEEHFDMEEFDDWCESVANAWLCDNAEPKEQPDYGDIESDGVF
jgi:hypothetical protein